jgi:hypothetical protein
MKTLVEEEQKDTNCASNPQRKASNSLFKNLFGGKINKTGSDSQILSKIGGAINSKGPSTFKKIVNTIVAV